MTAALVGSSLKPVYSPNDVTVSAGDITFLLKNVPAAQQELPPAHNFILGAEPPEFTSEGWIPAPAIASSSVIGSNKSELMTVEDLAPGSYSFWCTVEGHFTSGMVGTLTVTQ